VPKDPKPLFNLGILFSAQERYPEAAALFRRALDFDAKFYQARLNLGETLQRLGRYDEALREYHAARPLLPAPWLARVTGQAIPDCERERSLCLLVPRLERGEIELPAGAAARQLLAVAAYRCGSFALAARCFEQAFLAAAREWVRMHRYHAACMAVRAAGGEGPGADKLSAADRAHWRGLALCWLREECAAWAVHCRSDKPGERAWGRWKMRHRLSEAHLAGVRDPDRLTQLPEGERASWAALWADVRGLAWPRE
jgi:tetratricopeptide (TPR) repeat protein